MKTKLAIMAVFCGICMTASAVTISWNANGSAQAIFGLTSGTAMTTTGSPSQTASLVMYYFDYADYNDIVALGKVDATAVDSYKVAMAEGNTSTSTSAAGRVKASSTNTSYTDAGAKFFARAYATFDGKGYFIDLFGGSGADGTWTLTASGDARTTEKFAWTTPASGTTYGGTTSNTVGTKNAWVAVPEPSVALMGLLGLGMLIKRRRA